ncbi:MAG: hypothetical protein QNJ55_16270 [Xenococcus sp. MO_188.B8]|nr:hypothetical protein [Xenococcus sp. MO_188.B8]
MHLRIIPAIGQLTRSLAIAKAGVSRKDSAGDLTVVAAPWGRNKDLV